VTGIRIRVLQFSPGQCINVYAQQWICISIYFIYENGGKK